MKPLIVLLTSFLIALLATKIIAGYFEIALSARIAMTAMLVFTSVAHFVFTKGMAMMIPGFIPYKKQVVYITGIIEIIAAAGLLIPSLRVSAAWLLILFFLLLLPANIKAAIHHINYQNGTRDGNGITYLWFRVPLQVFFIFWTYFAAIKF